MALTIPPPEGEVASRSDDGGVFSARDIACGDYPSTASRSPSPSGGGFEIHIPPENN